MLRKVASWGGGDVWCLVSGEFPSNAYICTTHEPAACILIDGGLDPMAIDAAMHSLAVRPHAVFCTHGHFDHVGSASYFQRKDGVQVYLHEADVRTMQSSNFFLHAFKYGSRIELPELVLVKSGESVPISGGRIVFHSAPGHTPGSCLLELGSSLFTGDTIYASTVGLSKLPGEDHVLLRSSILKVWPMLSEGFNVHPGHGRNCTGPEVCNNNHALLDFLYKYE